MELPRRRTNRSHLVSQATRSKLKAAIMATVAVERMSIGK
jgi:hypothetical protein